ncbi:MAG: Uncharacterized protein MJ1480, partial [uncultured Frankineae bacterium]
ERERGPRDTRTPDGQRRARAGAGRRPGLRRRLPHRPARRRPGARRRVVRPDRGVRRRRRGARAAAHAPAGARDQPGRPGRGAAAGGRARRRVPGRLLLHHQPRDRRAPRLGLGAGRAAGDGLRSGGRGRSRPHRPGQRRARRAVGRVRRQGRQGGPAAARAQHRGRPLRVHELVGVEREAAVAAAAADRPADARGQGRRRQGAVGRRTGRGPHGCRTGDGRARRGRLRRRAVRRQRPGHPRHRGRAVRHVARGGPRRRQGRRARARAPHPGDQPDPQGRVDRRRRRAGRPDRRGHARAGDARQVLRPRRLRPRRRTPAGRPHRRGGGSAGDAGRAARRRLRDHGGDDAALHRDRQPAARLGTARVRRHQPRDGHQARRPGLGPGGRDRHRHRAVPRGPGPRAGARLPARL